MGEPLHLQRPKVRVSRERPSDILWVLEILRKDLASVEGPVREALFGLRVQVVNAGFDESRSLWHLRIVEFDGGQIEPRRAELIRMIVEDVLRRRPEE